MSLKDVALRGGPPVHDNKLLFQLGSAVCFAYSAEQGSMKCWRRAETSLCWGLVLCPPCQ